MSDRFFEYAKKRIDEINALIALSGLAESVAGRLIVEVGDIKSHIRSLILNDARRILAAFAVHKRMVSTAEVARCLDRHPATVSEILLRAQKDLGFGADKPAKLLFTEVVRKLTHPRRK